MSNPYAPEGQDSWNPGNDQGGQPDPTQPYGQGDPNAANAQTQQFSAGYGDQTQQFPAGYGDQPQQFPGEYGSGAPQPPEKKSKLPIIVAAIAGVVVLALIAVAAVIFLGDKDEPKPDPTKDPTPTASNSASNGPTPTSSGAPTGTSNTGSYHANGSYSVDFKIGVHTEITKIEKGPVDEDGANTILVTYQMTNNSSDEVSATFYTPDPKQKGIDMQKTYFERGKEPAGVERYSFVTVPAGQTKTFTWAYKFPNDSDPVVFTTLDFDDFRASIPDWTWQP
ncbi:MAG: DUF5067 domain-containing protein [Actinomyces bouchesdurhonensis]|uniref:DUF5067 domain-containing protein n=1 Tax=Actinomyces bouchesdurhonensis TaxID=1852361 RepID=A0A929RPS2_9ACTO|nr:DUF5067 domain-containing protein [Actinomyces bouchesdurhonensis]